MTSSKALLSPSETARQLDVSIKALRHYEAKGLIHPRRSKAGWRAYGATDLERIAEIVALRKLGLGLAQVVRVLDGDPADLEAIMADQQTDFEGQLQQRQALLERLQARLEQGTKGEGQRRWSLDLDFDLPWPWDGERFTLSEVGPLTFITGPLGSGKTRLAEAIAKALERGVFVGLERGDNDAEAARRALRSDAVLSTKVDSTLAKLLENGATASSALIAVITALEEDPDAVPVFDLIEDGLDDASQQALIGHLRRRRVSAPPLFLMTRSTAILDLAVCLPGETVLYCPANHSPPSLVPPMAGSPGYESVANCLATPEVRARTQGVIAMRPEVA